ncbi:MAG: peptidylprolyl isomerase, partial [Ilumatobacteraceae bacterium]
MRGRATLLVAAALVGVAACSDTRSNDAAAEVGGASISRERYEDLMRELAANPEVFGIQEDFETGTIAADVGRNVLSALVSNVASADLLETRGVTIAEADRQAIIEGFGPQAEGAPPNVLELEVDRVASGQAIGRLTGESGEAQAAYEAAPADVGVICVRHILLDTEEEATEVVAELDAGADFSELAAERSTDPSAAANGGAIEASPEQPCIALEQAQGSLDPVFTAAAIEAVPGTPIGPVQTSFGWHVILARPYEEVAAAVDPIVGQRLLDEHLADVDVQIDPRYGRWDAATGAVVALDAPA